MLSKRFGSLTERCRERSIPPTRHRAAVARPAVATDVCGNADEQFPIPAVGMSKLACRF
jgi:hypothetical protein